MTNFDRSSLHFSETVEAEFEFLAANDFKLVKREATFVRFESNSTYMNVYHGRMSFELGLAIGQLGRLKEEPYSMSEIVRFVEPGKGDQYRDYGTRDARGVEEGVQRLATRLRRYVATGLFDDGNLFTRLRRQREIYMQELALEVNLGEARRKLEGAWHANDYAKVVKLLEPFRVELTSAVLKKLEYAEKELRN